MEAGNRRARVLTLCCGLSGAASLVHELVWTRRTELLLGTSLRTAAAVLAATLGGMAIGAALAGRREDRLREGARAYAAYELLLALYCLLLPGLMGLADPLFAALHAGGGEAAPALRTALAMALLLPGALLMGATFPPAVADLVRHLRHDHPGTLARLYAANTFGAFLGALGGGLWLRPALGTQGTLWAASGLSLAAGLLAWTLGPSVARTAPAATPAPPEEPEAPGGGIARGVVYGVYALSGFTALAYEVLLHRMASLWIGGSSFAFAMVLAVFLLGLSTGAALAPRARRLAGSDFGLLAALQGGVFLWVLALAAVAAEIPVWLATGLDYEGLAYPSLLGLQFLGLAVLLLPGTLCLGATLPVAASSLGLREQDSAGLVSRLYAANALGCVLGALLGGHLLLPALGLRGALLATAAINLLAGAAALWPTGLSRGRVLAGAGALGALALWVPPWDAAILSSGPYIYASAYRDAAGATRSVDSVIHECGEVLFHRDGAYATATVRLTGGGLYSLQVNGKTDASNKADMQTQQLLAHLPLLIHPGARDMLVIGLGSGVTAGAALAHPLEHLDVVEIAPEVVEASRYFDPMTGAPLDDPRTELHLEDGRAWVQWTRRSYDVLSSEPSNPWIAGIANLFTREFFGHCRERLRPGGVMIQWLQAYSISPEDFRSVVATFSDAFPGATLWKSSNQTDFFLVGRRDGARPDAARMVATIESDTALGATLRSHGLDATQLALSFVTGTSGVRSLAEGVARITDDHPFLEFTTPKNLYRNQTDAVLRAVLAHSKPGTVEETFASPEALSRRRQALEMALEDRDRALELVVGGRAGEASVLLEKALEAMPDDPTTRDAYSLLHTEGGRRLWREGRHREGVALLDRLLERLPEEVEARHLRAMCLSVLGENRAARDDLEMVILQTPDDRVAYRNLSVVLYQLGDFAKSLGAFLRSLNGTRPTADEWLNLGELYRELGKFPKAALAWRKSLEADPDQPEVQELLDLYLEATGEDGVAANLDADL